MNRNAVVLLVLGIAAAAGAMYYSKARSAPIPEAVESDMPPLPPKPDAEPEPSASMGPQAGTGDAKAQKEEREDSIGMISGPQVDTSANQPGPAEEPAEAQPAEE